VRLSEDVYARIESKKRDDETFSEAIDRLIDDVSLLDLAEEEPVIDKEKHHERMERVEEADRREQQEMLERMGIDTE